MRAAITFDDISAAYGARTVLSGVTAAFERGVVTGIVGPNGAGKTTLFRVALNLIKMQSGSVSVLDKALAQWSREGLARTIAYLPQGSHAHWPILARQLVALGRLPHRAAFAALSAVDAIAVEEALARCDALQFAARRMDELSAGERARAAGERARLHVEEMHKAEGDQVFVKRIERSEGEDGQRIREDVRIRVARDMADGQPLPGGERFGPLLAGAFGDMKWASKATTKDLGSKEVEGIKAQGKLRSYEIPAGEIGNRNAIVVATETWYSPELQVTVLSKHSDPRSGERVYRLAGIKREEPAAALFAIPSDYTVKDPIANMRKAEAKK